MGSYSTADLHGFFLYNKLDTIYAFTQFKNMAENQLNKKSKAIQCDGCGEYKVVQKLD